MNNIFQKAINYGLKKGVDQIELFLLDGHSDVVLIEKNAIKATECKSLTGVSVRAYTNKGLGIATNTLIDEKNITKTIKEAVILSKLSPPDDLFKSLPGPFDNYPKVVGLFDYNLKNLSDEQLIDLAIESIDSALEKDKVIVSGNVNRTYAKEHVINSNGIEVSDEFSSISGVIFAKAEKNFDIATSWEYQKTRSKKEFNPQKIGQTAATNAISLLGSKKIHSAKLPIILDYRSTLDTLSSIIGDGLDAYEVILKTAFFKDRLGEQITSDEITLIDNPLYASGVGSSNFDDEGVPHQILTLIEKGVAKSFFTNSYCANALGIKNSGNASKISLNSKPYPDLTQVQISPGTWSLEEMIAETKHGLYLKDSSLEPTSGSPNISDLIDQGFLIKNGEITHPLKETMVGTTIFELLKSIDAVSKEVINENGSISPAIRITKVNVAGGK